jgi:8-oxo-dGTP pyrophosphatase MutT (NUDIX family)
MKINKITRKKLSSKLAYQNPYYKVWEDDIIRPTGKPGKYYWIQAHPAVFVVPVTEKMETYLVGQYRYPVKTHCLEVVAGGSEGKNLLKTAKRELWEETGLVAKKWKKVGMFCPWNGITSEVDYVYLASGLTQTGHNEQAEEGIDQVVKVSLNKTLEMIGRGQIKDGQSIAALTQAALYLKIIKL